MIDDSRGALRRIFLVVSWLTFGACVRAPSEGATPAPDAAQQRGPAAKWGEVEGTSLLPGAGVKAFQVHGKRERVVVAPVRVDGQPFSEALRVEIKERSDNAWDVQLQAPTAAAVEQGDVVLATFYVRTERSLVESGEGDTEFVFELARDPWTKSVSYPVKSGREWRKIHVPYVAGESYAPGQAQMIFRLGYAPQTIEIGGVSVENFGKRLALADLPVTKITYRGREADAAWRRAAEERIEKHRKGDLQISVKDGSGKPVPDAELELVMKRHAFHWGTAVQAALITGQADPRYLAALKELFNCATLENDLKWQPLAGDWGGGFTLERAQKAVRWLNENGLAARGHVLVWPGFRNLPKYVVAMKAEPPKLQAEVRKHVRDLASAMKGTLVHWDVVNEPFDNHDLMDILGEKVMVEWFREARAADPTAQLFINDYAILSGGGGPSAHRDHYEKTIRSLLKEGAPLDAIGMQGHFGNALTAPEDMLQILDRFAELGKPLYVTEYDVVVDDEALAADFTRDLLTVMFSQPAARGFIMWGFWDGAHWKQNAPLFRRDFSAKPALEQYRKLVLDRWWTREKGKTDASGSARLRGFQGLHVLSVTKGGKRTTAQTELDADGTTLTVTLD